MGNIGNHPADMRAHFWCLRMNGGIDIDHLPTRLTHPLIRSTQQHTTIRSTVLRISIRKMPTNITQPRCTQQGIRQSMQQHISIRVPQQTQTVLNLHATND